MEVVINVAYGGENLAQEVLVNRVRDIRKVIKEEFSPFIQEGLEKIKIYLFLNGDLTSYYDRTGLYKPTYYSKKKEFVINICFDTSNWSNNYDSNLLFFNSSFCNLLIDSIKVLDEKLRKNKIFIDLELYTLRINKIFAD